MHTKEARRSGFSGQWINLVCVWCESPHFDERERAVLGWTEVLTNVAETPAPDDVYESLKAYLTDEEMTKITVAIGTINVWNRLCVGFRTLPPIEEPA